jgi:formylglycine-generating enzyme
MVHANRVTALASVLLAACSRAPTAQAQGDGSDAGSSVADAAPASSVVQNAAAQPVWKVAPPGPMVLIHGGLYWIGGKQFTPELKQYQPKRQVKLEDFQVDVTEVTVAAYRACVQAGACLEPKGDPGCNWNRPGFEDDPINCVSWAQAVAYCTWAGKELPTEELWEATARGKVGQGRDFPWGYWDPKELWGIPDDIDSRTGSSWLCKTPSHPDGWTTCPVGLFPKGDTPEGVKDMGGNVSEWTATPYCGCCKSGCASTEKIVKGCDYSPSHFCLYTSLRHFVEPTVQHMTIGFRCVKTTSTPDGGAPTAQ